MKNLIPSIIVLALMSCGDDISVCPSGPYSKHQWEVEYARTDYCIQKCDFCNRHRRFHYQSGDYEYEDMSNGGLTIRVSRDQVKD